MAEEPIRKEDIIDEVAIINAIQALLDKLKELGIGIENLKKIAAGMGDGLKNANPATPEGQAAIKEYSDGLKDVAEKTKILSDIEKELLRRSEELAKQTGLSNKEFAEQSRALVGAQRGFNKANNEVGYAEGSLAKLRQELSKLKKAYVEASPGARGGLTENLTKLDKEVKKLEADMGVFSRNVGNYKSGFAGLAQKVASVAGASEKTQEKVGLIAEKFSGLGLIIGGAVTGGLVATFGFLKTAFESTGTSGDKLEMMTEGVKQGFDAIKRAVVNLDFKDFIKNVKAAYEEGRRYAEGLDSVDEKTRALQIAEADANKQILENLKISRSQKYSKDEQIAAGKEIVRLEEKLAGIRTGIAQQAYDNEITNISQITRLTAEEVLAYARQEKGITDNLKTGKNYNDMLIERDKLKSISLQGIKLTEEQFNRLKELNNIIPAVTEETKRFAFAYANIATDDKMQVLVDKYVALKSAETSALQGTMRVQTQIDSKEEAIDKKKTDNSVKQAKITKQIAGEELEGIDAVIIKKKELSEITIKGSEDNIRINEEIAASNQRLIDSEEALQQKKLENTQKYLEIASRAINVIADLIESAKQRELSAAGDNAKAREKIEKEYFKKQKAIAISQAIINGALGVVTSLTGAPIIKWIEAALVTVTTAAQIAIISAQKFAEGGEIFGKSHAQGGTMIEAERGEYVVKKESTSKYKKLIEAINDDNPMRIAEEIRNRNFHTVWGGVSTQLSQVSKQDPYTRMMYELMKNDIKTYIDSNGDTVLSYPNGTKRVIRKYTA